MLHAWRESDGPESDETRLGPAFSASRMLAEDNPVHLIPNTSDNWFIDSDYAKEEGT